MPYIKQLFTEGGFMTEMKDLLVSNGWTAESTFKKLGFNFGSFYQKPPNSSVDPDLISFTIYLADHIVVRNGSGELFGMARMSSMQKKFRDLPAEFRGTERYPDSAKLVAADGVLREKLHQWMIDQFNNVSTDTSELYFYMLKDKPFVENGTINVYPSDDAQAVIDVENLGYKPFSGMNGSTLYYYFEGANSHPEIMQSPMMRVKTREVGTAGNGWMTNWWSDSKIRVEGRVSSETVSIIIQCDNTAAYADNNVPTIPIYMGQLVPEDAADTNESVLFGGTAVPLATYDYRSTKPHTATPLMPIGKNYAKKPGNGIDNIIVKRAKLGAFYQAYYLSFHTGSDTMPPDRVSTDGRSYASAWKNQQNDEYQYQFNPSRYLDKVVASRAYVIHPEEGVRGYLKDMLMTSSIGLNNTDRLKVKREACPNVFDLYKYYVVDAVSPLTKSPAIVYSPAGFAIYEKEAN